MGRLFVNRHRGGDYLDTVRQALAAYRDAQNYFENVTNPDLVDYAIYDMEAARKRYVYLLKMDRQGQEVIELRELEQEAE